MIGRKWFEDIGVCKESAETTRGISQLRTRLEKEWVNFHALRAYYRILSVDEAMREGDL